MFAHWWELGLILLLALVVFGPKRLPEIGSSMGRGIREFKKATTESDDAPKETERHIPASTSNDEAS